MKNGSSGLPKCKLHTSFSHLMIPTYWQFPPYNYSHSLMDTESLSETMTSCVLNVLHDHTPNRSLIILQRKKLWNSNSAKTGMLHFHLFEQYYKLLLRTARNRPILHMPMEWMNGIQITMANIMKSQFIVLAMNKITYSVNIFLIPAQKQCL